METQDQAPRPQPTPEQLARAQELAKKMAADPGMQDLKRIPLALGSHAARDALLQLVACGEAKEAAMIQRDVKRIPIEPTRGSLRIDYCDRETKQPGTVFIILASCAPDHDMGAQCNKIYPHINEAARKQMQTQMSVMIMCARTTYNLMAQENQALMARIEANIGEDAAKAGAPLHALKVDKNNTTLYVVPGQQQRVGIYICRPDEELSTGDSASAPSS